MKGVAKFFSKVEKWFSSGKYPISALGKYKVKSKDLDWIGNGDWKSGNLWRSWDHEKRVEEWGWSSERGAQEKHSRRSEGCRAQGSVRYLEVHRGFKTSCVWYSFAMLWHSIMSLLISYNCLTLVIALGNGRKRAIWDGVGGEKKPVAGGKM